MRIKMTNNTYTIEEKATHIGEEIKQQFAKAGESAKNSILDNFKNMLEDDVSSLKATVEKIVADHGQDMAKQVQEMLSIVVKQGFGGTIFGVVLQDLVLPVVFNS